MLQSTNQVDQAREEAAMADAQRKDEVYAKAAGAQLERVERITEESGVASPVPMMARAQAAPLPIAIGLWGMSLYPRLPWPSEEPAGGQSSPARRELELGTPATLECPRALAVPS